MVHPIDMFVEAINLANELSVMLNISLPSNMEPLIDEQCNTPKDNITIVLDRSYSMEGDKLSAARKALIELYPSLLSDFDAVRLLVFDSAVENWTLSNMKSERITSLLHSIIPRGGTNFRKVFERLKEIYATQNAMYVNLGLNQHLPSEKVIFLTDGCDSEMFSTQRSLAISQFSRFLKSLPFTTQVNCIGLGKYHDAQMLTGLSAAGKLYGSFFYSENASSILDAFDTTHATASAPSFGANLQLYDEAGHVCNENPIPLNFSEMELEDVIDNVSVNDKDKEKRYTSGWNVNCGESNACVAEVHLPDGTRLNRSFSIINPIEMLTNFVTTEEEKEKCAHVTDVTYIIVKKLVSEVLRELPMHESDVLYAKKVYKKFEELHRHISEYVMPLALNSKQKQARATIMETNMLLGEVITKALSPLLRGTAVNNSLYAELAHHAFSVSKNRSQKLLGKRAAKNAQLIDRLDRKISKIVSKIDFSQFNGRQLENEYGTCVFSMMNVLDAMKEGDCMCIGLHISRPEEAIADPSRIKISSISKTFVTANSFLCAASMRLSGTELASSEYLDDSDDEYNSDIGVHGGFNSQGAASGSVIQGVSREQINGALPLFVNESHWRIARLKCKPLFGWMATLDVLGFSTEQMNVIPFLVLDKILTSSDKSEFWLRLENWVMQTCLEILKENHSVRHMLFTPDIDDTRNFQSRIRYLNEVEARLPDSTSSHIVLFRQLRVAEKAGIYFLEDTEKKLLALYSLVEEYRREYSRKNCNIVDKLKTLATITGCTETHIAQSLEKVVEARDVSSMSTDEINSIMENLIVPQWKIQYQDSAGNGPQFHRLFLIYKAFVNRLSSTEEERCLFNELEDAQKLSIITICVKYPKSSDIREQVFEYQEDLEKALKQPKKWLSDVFSYVVKSQVKKEINSMLASRFAFRDASIAKSFASAKTLNDARSATKNGLYIGRNVSKCVDQLCLFNDGIPVLEVKEVLLKMLFLMKGIYKRENVYGDKDDIKRKENFGGYAWKPKRKRVYRLFKVYELNDSWEKKGEEEKEKSRQEWVRTFPWLKREISIWCNPPKSMIES